MFRSIAAVRHELPKLLPLLRSERVPMWAKAVAIGAAVLVVSPLDLLGDIPVIGLFDDGALLLFIVHTFVTFAEKRAGDAPLVATQ